MTPEEVQRSPTRSHASDLALARRTLAGERAAEREFVERMRCVPKILAAQSARLRNPIARSDLEDLSQETLLTIWRRLDTYEGMATLESWAWGFCHLTLANFLRVRGRRPPLASAGEHDVADASRGDVFEFERLHLAVEQLAAGDRQVLHLKNVEELTFDQIAERLAEPASTVKTHYYRAIEALRRLLAGAARQEGT